MIKTTGHETLSNLCVLDSSQSVVIFTAMSLRQWRQNCVWMTHHLPSPSAQESVTPLGCVGKYNRSALLQRGDRSIRRPLACQQHQRTRRRSQRKPSERTLDADNGTGVGLVVNGEKYNIDGCETWSVTLRGAHRLRMLRNVWGAMDGKVTGHCRKLHDRHCSQQIISGNLWCCSVSKCIQSTVQFFTALLHLRRSFSQVTVTVIQCTELYKRQKHTQTVRV